MIKTLFIDAATGKTVTAEDFTTDFQVDLNDVNSISTSDIVGGFQDLIPALGYNAFDGHTYVSGATESGKSFLINKMLMNDRRKRNAFLFTDLKKRDKSFMPMFDSGRLKIVRDRASDPWEADFREFQAKVDGSILIFDDVSDPSHLKLRDNALLKGRHRDVIVIAVNHKLRNWLATIHLLTDAKYIVGFPSSNRGTILKYVKEEFGVSGKVARFVIKKALEDGRQISFHRFAPNVVATQKSIIRL
jgi:hypothetical protein